MKGHESAVLSFRDSRFPDSNAEDMVFLISGYSVRNSEKISIMLSWQSP
jgi:hypothetical protein